MDKVICPLCRSYVDTCDQCRDALVEGDDVYCVDEGSAHTCEKCIEDYLRDQHMVDSTTLEAEEESK
jgi:hypothetical protein